MMQAVVQDSYGPPEVLRVRDVAAPTPRDGEVLVRVRATALHPDVWHVVLGRPFILRLMGAGLRRPANPIPGTDVAGVVETVGVGVTGLSPGDAVFGVTTGAHAWTHGGALAEQVAVRQDLLARKPANVTFEQAASVPTSGYIALLNLRGGTVIGAGDRVLVNGAGGGVGSIALQVAKARGGHVTAVDAPAKLAMLQSLGADEVLDYTRDDFTRGDARYDLIVDIPGNHPLSACRRVLRPGGKYVLIGHEQYDATRRPVLGLLPRMVGLMGRALFRRELRLGRSGVPSVPEAVEMLRHLLETGHLTPVVDSTYPLEEVHEAFRHMIEDEARGRVIITP